VGDGPERPQLERRFNGSNARFLGYLKGKELAAAYASADVFVYASETETMGNVVLEAMACGCPVVAPNAGGIPSLLTHGQTGFLYRPRDWQEAVRCTRTLLDNEGIRFRVGRAARQSIEGRNWEHSVARVREVYVEAIKEGRQRPAAPWTWRQRLAQATTEGLVNLFRSLAPREKRRRPVAVA
jgi:glycosyltransferase involved in cell wall biosynthesis